MAQVLGRKSRKTRALHSVDDVDAGLVLLTFRRDYLAATRQYAFCHPRDFDAALFLVHEDCRSQARALEKVAEIFSEKIECTSFFEGLAGLYGWRADRQCKGEPKATTAELRRFGDLFAECARERGAA